MDVAAGADVRLGFLLVINALVVLATWRFVRKSVAGDWVDRAADIAILFYLVQYVSVCIAGVIGSLGPITIAAFAATLCGLLLLGSIFLKSSSNEEASPTLTRQQQIGLSSATVCLAFLLGYILSLAYYYRHLPVISNDALTYHFPAAAAWLQAHKITLFETWFFNPANTYSPLAGSTFIAWLMAPLGNDTIASFVQIPALVGLWFVIVRLTRQAGLDLFPAILTATAAATAQPFIRASVLSKDDLFVAMFFGAALSGLSPRLRADRLGPWRVGAAAGLMLATKYTALLALPILAVACLTQREVQTLRSSRKHLLWWIIAMGCTFILAGPWYLRNWITFHNPIFPVEVGSWLPGIFSTEVSPRFRSWIGIFTVFARGDDALPLFLLVILIIGWIGLVWSRRRQIAGDPILRTLALGPVIGIGLFVWGAPYAEIRFLYPVLILGFVGLAAAIQRIAGDWRVCAAMLGVVAALSALTGLPIVHALRLLPVGIVVAAIAFAARWVILQVKLDWTHGLLAGLMGAAGLAGLVYVYWPAYVRQSSQLAALAWEPKYGHDLTQSWAFVRLLPPHEKVAYANTFLIYPLMGFEPTRPVEYIPVRHQIYHLADLPYQGRISGDEMVVRMTQAANTEIDEAQWLQKLSDSGAKYLFVEKRAGFPIPPELSLADKHPERFVVLFDNASARVYDIH